MDKKVVCIGEILWDAMPSGLFLGGAPYNVAYHMNHLGVRVSFISRVGRDRLGREASRRMGRAGLSTRFLQVDEQLETGFVEVVLAESGKPEYEIINPAAWDAIELTETARKVIRSADAVVFGTLAQRSEISRQTIRQLKNCRGMKVLDLNFRKPYVDSVITQESLEMADVVKMNDEELEILRDWYQLPGNFEADMAELADRFSIQLICVTCGAEGARLYRNGDVFRADGIPVSVRDTVGAGDAFLAALVTGKLQDVSPDRLVDLANRFGAYVATCEGGTPDCPVQSFDGISSLSFPIQKEE